MIGRPLAEEQPLFRQMAGRFCHQLRSALGGDADVWEDEPAFAASLGEACDAVLHRAVDPAFQTRQHARFGQGQPLGAFSPQLLSVGPEADRAHAVAELRFKSMDPTRAFVELSLLTPEAPRYLAQLVAGALSAFASFRPDRARASLNASERGVASAAGLGVEADLHCVAAGVRTLRNLPRSGPPRLGLRPIDDVQGCYARYVSLYEAFEGSCPPIARELYRSSLAEFSEMVSHGKSFEAFFESRWAGLVAATPAALWGQPGWVMSEEFLSAEFRGRGLGLDLQRALFERLEAERGVLWGTIHATNRPSVSTAVRHGRKVVQTHYWLMLAEASLRPGEFA